MNRVCGGDEVALRVGRTSRSERATAMPYRRCMMKDNTKLTRARSRSVTAPACWLGQRKRRGAKREPTCGAPSLKQDGPGRNGWRGAAFVGLWSGVSGGFATREERQATALE